LGREGYWELFWRTGSEWLKLAEGKSLGVAEGFSEGEGGLSWNGLKVAAPRPVAIGEDEPQGLPSPGIWIRPSSVPKMVAVTFNSNGGSAADPVTLPAGGSLLELPVPYRQGYAFKGWFLDEGLAEEYAAGTPIWEDLALYAKWEEYYFNNGLPSSVIKFKKNDKCQIVIDTNISDPSVVYYSNKPTIASVTSEGVVRGVTSGSAVITVSTIFDGNVYSYSMYFTIS
jgi:uncharacterized repeat protein (TIGR02543 family)